MNSYIILFIIVAYFGILLLIAWITGGRAQAMKRFSLVTVNHLGTSYQSEWSGHRFQVSHSFLFRGWYAA